MSKRFAGLDLARSRDHSALVVIESEYNSIIGSSSESSISNGSAQPQHRSISVVDAVEYPHLPLEDIAERIRSKYDEHGWSMLYIDATGFGGVLAYDILAARNVSCRCITFTNRLKNEMINNLIALIAEKRLRIPRVYDRLVEQLLQQRRVVTGSSIRYEHPAGRHDDLFWALCLACLAYRDMMDGGFIAASRKFSTRENLYGNYHAIYFREW